MNVCARSAGVTVRQDSVMALALERCVDLGLSEHDFGSVFEAFAGTSTDDENPLSLKLISSDAERKACQCLIFTKMLQSMSSLEISEVRTLFPKLFSQFDVALILDEEYRTSFSSLLLLFEAPAKLYELGPEPLKTCLDALSTRTCPFKAFMKSSIGLELVAGMESHRTQLLKDAEGEKELNELKIPVASTGVELITQMPAAGWAETKNKFSWNKVKSWQTLKTKQKEIEANASSSFMQRHAEKFQSLEVAKDLQFKTILQVAVPHWCSFVADHLASFLSAVEKYRVDGEMNAEGVDLQESLRAFRAVVLPTPDALHSQVLHTEKTESMFETLFGGWSRGRDVIVSAIEGLQSAKAAGETWPKIGGGDLEHFSFLTQIDLPHVFSPADVSPVAFIGDAPGKMLKLMRSLRAVLLTAMQTSLDEGIAEWPSAEKFNSWAENHIGEKKEKCCTNLDGIEIESPAFKDLVGLCGDVLDHGFFLWLTIEDREQIPQYTQEQKKLKYTGVVPFGEGEEDEFPPWVSSHETFFSVHDFCVGILLVHGAVICGCEFKDSATWSARLSLLENTEGELNLLSRKAAAFDVPEAWRETSQVGGFANSLELLPEVLASSKMSVFTLVVSHFSSCVAAAVKAHDVDGVSSLIKMVQAEKITKERAGAIFRFCCTEQMDLFTNSHMASKNAKESMQEMMKSHHYATVGDEQKKSFQELVDTSAQGYDRCNVTCAALTASVALWRQLGMGEERSNVVQNARASLEQLGVEIPKELDVLMTARIQGRRPYHP